MGQEKTLYIQNFRQYHHALQELRKLAELPDAILSSADRQGMVLANWLFMILAMLRGDIAECFTHYRNGTRLTGKWKMWLQTKLYRPSDRYSLHAADSLVYLCIRCHSIMIHLRPTDYIADSVWPGCKLVLRDHPFISLTEACFELELIWNISLDATMELLSPDPNTVEEVSRIENIRNSIRKRATLWQQKFADFDSTRGQSHQLATAVLRIRLCTTTILLFAEAGNCAMSWDQMETAFDDVLEQAQHIIHLREARMDSFLNHKTQGRAVTVAPMINECLYVTVRLCRSPDIRRRAVALLRDDFFLSPTIDTALYIGMSEALINIEEKSWVNSTRQNPASTCGCIFDQFICQGHRVRATAMEYPSEGTAILCAKTYNDIENYRPWQKVDVAYGAYKGKERPVPSM